MKKSILFIILGLLLLGGLGTGYYFYHKKKVFDALTPTIKLLGNDTIEIGVNSEFKDEGAKAEFNKQNISKDIIVDNNVDTTKVGTYYVVYEVTANNKKVNVKRTVNVVDKDLPVIELVGDIDNSFYVGEAYEDPGYTATDSYDGDLTSKVSVTNNVDNNTPGTYEIIYSVTDSSGNEATVKRNITVVPFKTLPSENATATAIAVLNYHFFYAPGEAGGGGNYMRTDLFEEQLKYLKDNNYKTLTMEEFRAWMYGEIELPARSVLITIDDGAAGTGAHNGNHLIPLLEKYEAHATLFLITGWWGIGNYQSPYLDVESHSHDMHTSSYCSGVSRGAQMLCMSDEEVLQDLKTSIEITGSDTSFCFPFYAYSEHAIELVQAAGFKIAFGGGGYKATRNSNKYAIPRYHMQDYTSLGTFVSMIA